MAGWVPPQMIAPPKLMLLAPTTPLGGKKEDADTKAGHHQADLVLGGNRIAKSRCDQQRARDIEPRRRRFHRPLLYTYMLTGKVIEKLSISKFGRGGGLERIDNPPRDVVDAFLERRVRWPSLRICSHGDLRAGARS